MQQESISSVSEKDPNILTRSMIEMIEIIEHAIDLEMEKDASPAHLANAAVIALCRVIGGTSIYLPKATALKNKIRNNGIFKDYRAGMSKQAICKKYKVCSQEFYKIVDRERTSSRLPLNCKGQNHEQ